MGIFLNYIKSRKKIIIFFIVALFTFVVILLLYKMPIDIIVYPTVLVILFGIIALCIDFINIKRVHNEFTMIMSHAEKSIVDFPEVNGILDNDYRNLVNALKEEIERIKSEDFARYCDMIEYYTIWVHQIKTPISAMKLSLQNENSIFSEKLQMQLSRIEQYVEMVLAFLRLNSDSTDYVFREYSIDEIVKDEVKKYASEFIDRKLQLEYQKINETVITDKKWFSFVIGQIISNALKYTSEGIIKIYKDSPKLLKITDTGIGIMPEDLPRIFEKGYTGLNGRNIANSSGIGLYLSKQILNRLGFEISAESEIYKGTTITINLEQNDIKKE